MTEKESKEYLGDIPEYLKVSSMTEKESKEYLGDIPEYLKVSTEGLNHSIKNLKASPEDS